MTQRFERPGMVPLHSSADSDDWSTGIPLLETRPVVFLDTTAPLGSIVALADARLCRLQTLVEIISSCDSTLGLIPNEWARIIQSELEETGVMLKQIRRRVRELPDGGGSDDGNANHGNQDRSES